MPRFAGSAPARGGYSGPFWLESVSRLWVQLGTCHQGLRGGSGAGVCPHPPPSLPHGRCPIMEKYEVLPEGPGPACWEGGGCCLGGGVGGPEGVRGPGEGFMA